MYIIHNIFKFNRSMQILTRMYVSTDYNLKLEIVDIKNAGDDDHLLHAA